MISWLAGTACVLASLFCDSGFPDGQKSLHRPDQLHNVVNSTNDAGRPPVSNGENVAQIVLYPGSRTYPDDLRNLGIDMTACEDEETQIISLATDVCLSGEYYARDNIKITQSPRCSDGSSPTLIFYPNRFCTGSPIQATDNHSIDDMAGRCLWSTQEVPIPSYYWSLIFRCNSEADSTSMDHQTAEPAILRNSIAGPVPGRVADHGDSPSACEDKELTQTFQTKYADPDRVMVVFSYPPLQSFEISAPAVCANGTRARFGMVETGRHVPTDMEAGFWVSDVDDWMLGTRINATGLELRRGGVGNATGFVFICEGKKPEGKSSGTAESRGPRISTSECQSSPARFQWLDPIRPQTFIYPEPMTCVNLPKGEQLRVSEKLTCPDGSKVRLAAWQEPDCQGEPSQITPIRDLECTSPNLRRDTSYMVWCGDEKDRQPEPAIEEEPSPEDDPRASVSKDECPSLYDPGPGWKVVSEKKKPTTQQMIPDHDCMRIVNDDQLKVYSNAKCTNGETAKVEVYAGECCGTPDSTFEVAKLVDTCTRMCDVEKHWHNCYFRFTCKAE